MRTLPEVDIPTVDIDAIQRALATAPVSAAVLYGSHARREVTDRSDVDIAVEFDASLSTVERTHARLALIERLTAELGTERVDVLPLSRAPPRLRREIAADGVIIQGSPDLELDTDADTGSHAERLAAFDDILADMEQRV